VCRRPSWQLHEHQRDAEENVGESDDHVSSPLHQRPGPHG
jgi:hypothetical protein